MRFIKCPHCRKLISDKVAVCPKCNAQLLEAKEDEKNRPAFIICDECGESYSSDMLSCPNCGMPAPAEFKITGGE